MPTLTYLTGFNHRTLAEGSNSTTGLSMDTVTVRRAGGTSLKLLSSGASGINYIRSSVSGSGSVFVEVAYINFSTLPTANQELCFLNLSSASGSPFAGVGYSTSTQQFCSYSNTGAVQTFSNPGGPTLTTGVWYRVEFKLNMVANPWLIDVQVAVGDASATVLTQTSAAFTAITDFSTQGPALYVGTGATGARTFTAFVTDIATSSTASDYPIGPISVYGYSPNSVGTHNLDASTSAYFFKEVSAVDTALTTAETTSYQTIDDVPIDADIDSIWVGTTSGSPNTPAFRSAGSVTFSANNVTNTSLTPGTPGTKSVGDLLVLVAACSSNANTVTTPTGWNLVSGFPKHSGTATGGSIWAYTRIADGTATDVPAVTFGSMTTGTSGTPGAVVILVYQNGTETLDGSLPTLVDTTATTTTTIPAFTTGTNNSMVIGIAMKMQDLAQTSTVATFTERVDSSTTNAIGWALEVSDKVQTTLGSSGTAAVTWSSATSGRTLAISLGFKSSLAVVQPTATWYAEYGFADESVQTSAPLAVSAIVAQALDTATSSTWAAKLVSGGVTEEISNTTISSVTKAYKDKTFSGSPLQISDYAGTYSGNQYNVVPTQTIAPGFTAGSTGVVRSVDLSLVKTTAVSGVIIELRTASGSSPSNTVLGTITNSGTSLPTSFGVAPATFTFPTPVPVVSGTSYFIVVRVASASDFYKLDRCSGGNPALSSTTDPTGNSGWTPIGTLDVRFRINLAPTWTLSALNAATLTFGYTAAASGHPRLEAAMLEAAYVPSVSYVPRYGFVNHSNPGIA